MKKLIKKTRKIFRMIPLIIWELICLIAKGIWTGISYAGVCTLAFVIIPLLFIALANPISAYILCIFSKRFAKFLSKQYGDEATFLEKVLNFFFELWPYRILLLLPSKKAELFRLWPIGNFHKREAKYIRAKGMPKELLDKCSMKTLNILIKDEADYLIVFERISYVWNEFVVDAVNKKYFEALKLFIKRTALSDSFDLLIKIPELEECLREHGAINHDKAKNLSDDQKIFCIEKNFGKMIKCIANCKNSAKVLIALFKDEDMIDYWFNVWFSKSEAKFHGFIPNEVMEHFLKENQVIFAMLFDNLSKYTQGENFSKLSNEDQLAYAKKHQLSTQALLRVLKESEKGVISVDNTLQIFENQFVSKFKPDNDLMKSVIGDYGEKAIVCESIIKNYFKSFAVLSTDLISAIHQSKYGHLLLKSHIA